MEIKKKMIANNLASKYPEFFDSPDFSIECEKGWYRILEDMFEEFRKNKLELEILQIKEKFGSLRVYVGKIKENKLDLVELIIKKAEDLSSKTCEHCGKEANIQNTAGWYKCICNKCRMFRKLRGY